MKKAWLTLIFMLVSSIALAQTVNQILSEREFRVGMLRFYNRQYQAAIQVFQRSLDLDPLNYRARYYLGEAYLQAGYTRQAIEEWENLIQLGGATYQVKQRLNDLYYQLSMDKNYTLYENYVLSQLYDGLKDGAHKVIRPAFLFYDEEEDTLLVSSLGNRYISEIDNTGRVIRTIGRKWWEQSVFATPMGIFLHDKKIYVADYTQDKIFVFNRTGKLLGSFGSHGYQSSNLAGPMGIVIVNGYLYVVDNGNDRIQKFTPEGEWVQTIGEGELNRPTDIVSDGSYLYVSDTANKRIVVYDFFGNFIREIVLNGIEEPRGLSLKGDFLYIVDSKKGIYLYNLQTEDMETLTTEEKPLQRPFDVAIDKQYRLNLSDINSTKMAIYTPLQMKYVNLGVFISQIWVDKYPKNLIHFRVLDREGNPIYNLRQENIAIYEENTLVPFIRLGQTYNYRDRLYLKIVIEMDPTMNTYREELQEFLKSIIEPMQGTDKLDLTLIGATTEDTGPYAAALLSTLEKVKNHPVGPLKDVDKALYNAVTSTLNVNLNKAIIYFTSGKTSFDSFTTYEPDVITTYARQNAVPIYVIHMGNRRQPLYQEMAEKTFGKYYTLENMKDIVQIYQTIRQAPPLEYVVSYTGLNLRGLPNFWVNVKLKVQYKDFMGVVDGGYFVPELFSSPFGPKLIDLNREQFKLRQSQPREE
ncbi:tetratricopeptide repeat protein [Thermospira aquatica]|uniref:Tetratricopeptide repeat protein n=1 Tax=Thermospira aquatica TaxID=2828656 RepID=A0AAX3BBG3_9SPIR|nr:tetratricopeptide repeat protein [Thermospira aquatica]URA09584.1 tetratricopeptide repeat protein [Thermospira aquatica]